MDANKLQHRSWHEETYTNNFVTGQYLNTSNFNFPNLPIHQINLQPPLYNASKF